MRKLEGDFDLVQGRATIDAKSFLGILSMDLSQTVKLIIQIIEDFENQNNPGAKA